MSDLPTCDNCSSRILTAHRRAANRDTPDKRDLCHTCHA